MATDDEGEREMSIQKIDAEKEQLRTERDLAIRMLAKWCVAIAFKGTNREAWWECYKAAVLESCVIRGLLDKAMCDEESEVYKD